MSNTARCAEATGCLIGGDGAIRAHRPLILEGGPDEVPLLATDLYE